jgi:hypothetical protein
MVDHDDGTVEKPLQKGERTLPIWPLAARQVCIYLDFGVVN